MKLVELHMGGKVSDYLDASILEGDINARISIEHDKFPIPPLFSDASMLSPSPWLRYSISNATLNHPSRNVAAKLDMSSLSTSVPPYLGIPTSGERGEPSDFLCLPLASSRVGAADLLPTCLRRFRRCQSHPLSGLCALGDEFSG